MHLMGLLSPGGVHSHEAHLQAIVEMASQRGVERVYVVDEVYDEFMVEATKAIDKLNVGKGDRSDIGPMIWPPQADTIERHVQDAVARGARIVRGGK